ncbi:zinc finger CCHC domain-containing protein 24-like [Battus philenor]|uniref:zinc finger CCHC domain-containing protein 24-like n=1 Tax=Battus philenor TaxID=42288 RepID=UPI0035CF88F8
MGCIWSCEFLEGGSSDVRSRNRTQHVHKPKPCTKVKPLFGQYKCSACGRSWSSRLCWPNRYQICNRCKNHVYAHSQRELLPSDIRQSNIRQEHKKDLCQMCQQLGYYCGSFGKSNS